MKDIKEIVKKLVDIEIKISDNKGPFNLFALFLRDGNDKWDLLVSSEWIDKEKYESLRYIVSSLQEELIQEEILEIAGIEIIDHDNPILDSIYKTIKTEHYIIEATNVQFFGFLIRSAYFITSKRPKIFA